MLRFIPDEEEVRTRWVTITDMARAREITGVAAPGGELTFDDDIEYLIALTGYGPEGPAYPVPMVQFLGLGPHDGGAMRALRETTGIGIAEQDQWVWGGAYFASRGRFDAEQLADRLAACTDCPPAGRDEYEGWITYAWGDEGQPLRPRAPGFEALGRLALRDGYFLRTDRTGDLHRMIDAREGRGSLAADRVFRARAAEFDRLRTVEAVPTVRTQDIALWSGVPERTPEGLDDRVLPAFSAEEMTVLRRYVGMGTGRSVDDSGAPFTTVVLAHESAETAAENVERMQRRFAQFVERDLFWLLSEQHMEVEMYEEVTVEADGVLLRVTLRGAGNNLTRPVIAWMAPLFLHE